MNSIGEKLVEFGHLPVTAIAETEDLPIPLQWYLKELWLKICPIPKMLRQKNILIVKVFYSYYNRTESDEVRLNVICWF